MYNRANFLKHISPLSL